MTCFFSSGTLPLQEFNLLLQDHRQIKQENDSLRQDIRQTQTLQSIVDTKVRKKAYYSNKDSLNICVRVLGDWVSTLFVFDNRFSRFRAANQGFE